MRQLYDEGNLTWIIKTECLFKGRNCPKRACIQLAEVVDALSLLITPARNARFILQREKMKKVLIALVFLIILSACSKGEDSSNQISDERMLLVLSAPSVHETYYQPAFDEIVDFQIEYAKAIMGNDNVVVIVDADTKPYYEDDLPEDILIEAEVYDIWARDFTLVNPINPVQFKYTWASMSKEESEEVQNSFNTFANKYELQRSETPLLLDGGNLVDNYAGGVITTTRFMEDNALSYAEAKEALST